MGGSRLATRRVARGVAGLAAAVLCGSALSLSAASAAAAQAPRPFGHVCTLESYGVRFCPTSSLGDRVPSFDGAPLDVDVTLPARGSGPWPTIFMAPPTGTDKTVYETTTPGGVAGFAQDYSNVWYANHGYAVVTYSMRGTFNSCGTVQSRAGYSACRNVQFEFADPRYDARDVQWLLGRLVGERIAARNALGVTGDSLGSITSLETALLYNRIRLPNGTFAPWRSPTGVPLHIAAVYTNASISDVLDAAAPNGRFLAFQPQTATDDHNPIGVAKLSFSTVFAGGTTPASNYWDVPAQPGGFDLPAGIALLEASEPDSPGLAGFAKEIYNDHQAIGMPLGRGTAPLLIEDGWEDVAVNGPAQALRLADYLQARKPNASVALQLTDWGHPLSTGAAEATVPSTTGAMAFFGHYLKGQSGGPVPGSVTAYTATCSATAQSAGPYVAHGMAALDPGAVRFSSAAPQTVVSGGDPVIGVGLDWLVAGVVLGSCQPFNALDWPGTAVYTRPVTQTFTMLGLPTMRLHVATDGKYGQLEARLWDVAPNGHETFVSRGTYALTDNQQGTITWQMWGGGYTFPRGDTIRVELLASDTPTERPSLRPFVVTVSAFTIELPSHDPPNGGEIVTPSLGG